MAFGHTHLPWHRVVEGVHFVNTGSVGRPKDGDSRAGWVLLTMDGNSVDVTFERVEYDVARAARAIRASELPDELADHLEHGGKPSAQGASHE